MLSFVSNTLHGSEVALGRWHLDEELVAEASVTDGTLSLRLTNTGIRIRTINKGLADEKYLTGNVVHVRCHSPGDPRSRIESYRIASDGVIGINSEIYVIKPLDIKPGDVVETKVALASALNKVAESNKALRLWKREGDGWICITLAISSRDIGYKSDEGIELVSPWIPFALPKK